MRTYDLVILDTEYTYRGLTRGEALDILREPLPEWDREQKIVERAVLFASKNKEKIPGDQIDWDNTLAGVVTELAIAIGEASGISEIGASKFNEETQAWINTPAGRAEMLMMGICGLTINQIHSFDPIEWYYHAAAAQTLYDLQNDPQKASQQPQMQPPPQPTGLPPRAQSARRKQVELVPEQNVMIKSN